MERTEQEELRILRRVIAQKQRKTHKGNPVNRVEAVPNAIAIGTAKVTLVLVGVPVPDSAFAQEIMTQLSIAQRHAQELCERLGYRKVNEIRFNGKLWEAKLEF